jgi:hypothetical protein
MLDIILNVKGKVAPPGGMCMMVVIYIARDPCRRNSGGASRTSDTSEEHDVTPDELRNALVGAWRLVSYEAAGIGNGDVIEPFGPQPQGLITYTPSGHMSAQIMHPERPNFRQGRLEEGLPEELAAATVGYMAYGGTYEVPKGDLMVHHVDSACFPTGWAPP